MGRFKESNTMYKNGFLTRLYNRRIICTKQGDDWFIKFIRYTKEKMTTENGYYDSCTKKMSGYITVKSLRLSEEAFINMTYMGVSFYVPTKINE